MKYSLEIFNFLEEMTELVMGDCTYIRGFL